MSISIDICANPHSAGSCRGIRRTWRRWRRSRTIFWAGSCPDVSGSWIGGWVRKRIDWFSRGPAVITSSGRSFGI